MPVFTMIQLPFSLRSILLPALAAALTYAAWRSYGLQGLLLAVLMLTFWVLLHFTKLMRLLRTAASRPMGHVRDARALHRHLKPGLPMTEVVRRSLSLGQRRSEPGLEPEVFEWGDEQGFVVTCSFQRGRLLSFELAAPGATPEGVANETGNDAART